MGNKMNTRVGIVQLAPVLGDRRATMAKIEDLLAGVDLPQILVFPELCNSGYNFSGKDQAQEYAEKIETSEFLDFMQGLARRSGGFVITGFNEKDDGQLFNTALLLGPRGVLGKYRKLHLFLNEKDYFQPGNLGLPVFDLGFCRLGMLICFDWLFPEVWRVLALRGAEIICHPSNLILPGLAQRGVAVHALINRVFVLLANRTGTEGDLSFTGNSQIVDPRGGLLTEADGVEEGVFLTEIDVEAARNKAITHRNDVFADRRPLEYSLLTQEMPRKKD